jgi:predicted MPP superfamily phosphohydrolase
MRTGAAIVFFAIFFIITGLISFYIYVRGLQSIPPGSVLRSPYSIIFWFVALSFIGGRIFERFLPAVLANLLIWVGSFWIAAMIYFLLAVICLDILRLVNHFLPFFPSVITDNYMRAKYITSASVLGLVSLLLLAGHINSLIPRVRALNIPISKKAGNLKYLNIVAASDIHLGTIVGSHRMDSIAKKINSLNPDLVLLPGDIVDEDLTSVIKKNPGEALRQIKSRFGIFAATGNHEHIAGVEKACEYLENHSVTVLRDESIKIADSFYVVGREDLASDRFDGFQRKTLPELMAEVDRSFPIILMDHQPSNLAEASREGIDLQLSGHTHNGQFWPANYIVDAIFELAWGYRKIGDTHFYVSNGVGTWGPPIRIGNRPEIVHIRLSFE